MGKEILLLLAAAFVLLAIPSVASAGSVWACGLNGFEVNSFYTNDTVYACGSNLTANVSGLVNIYIVTDTSSWTQNMTLNDASGGYRTYQTNATGDLPPSTAWSQPPVGNYDVVADSDRSGTYNSTDFVDSTSAVGFSVALQPWSTVLFELGPYSPSAHDWNLTSSDNNIMMHLKATAYESENIRLNSLSLTASGSGDDKTGIKYVKLVRDIGGDGIINSTDPLLAYNFYLKDNGVTVLNIDGGLGLTLGNASYLILAYVMSDTANNGATFKFQLTAASATGMSSGASARITGLPLESQTTSIVGAATTTTTTTTLPSQTTTTTLPATTTTSSSPTTTSTTTQTQPGGLNYALIAAIAVILIAAIAVVVYLLTRKKSEPSYTYEDVEKKWASSRLIYLQPAK